MLLFLSFSWFCTFPGNHLSILLFAHYLYFCWLINRLLVFHVDTVNNKPGCLPLGAFDPSTDMTNYPEQERCRVY